MSALETPPPPRIAPGVTGGYWGAKNKNYGNEIDVWISWANPTKTGAVVAIYSNIQPHPAAEARIGTYLCPR